MPTAAVARGRDSVTAMSDSPAVPPTALVIAAVASVQVGASLAKGLFDDVGPGGQFAVLVDGQIVSTPRFGTTPEDTGVVTDLDEPTARRLADRLRG